MAKRTRTYLLLEERLGEPLDAYVRDKRADGESVAAIVFDLATRTGERVTDSTLRNWFPDLSRPQEQEAVAS